MNIAHPILMGDFSINTARMLVNFAIEAYQDPENMALGDLGYELVKFIDNQKTDTQCFVAKNDTSVILAFRGTSSVKDALTDMRVGKERFPSMGFFRRIFSLRSIFQSKAHEGFYESYNSIRDQLLETMKAISETGEYRYYITGHSLGGALATIAALDLKMKLKLDTTLYTYGAPKVGNKRFVRYFNRKVKDSYRVVVDDDPVPSVPGITFKHVNNFALIDEKTKILLNPNIMERFEKGLESVLSTITVNALENHSSHNYKKLLDAINYP